MDMSLTIHIICAGNTFRSRLAEGYLKSLQQPGLTVMSSGYKAEANEDGPITFYARIIAKKQGFSEFIKPHWDQLTQKRIDQADIVVCVNREVHHQVSKRFSLPLTTYIWDIPDVIYPPLASDPKTDEEILAITEDIFEKIKLRVHELLFFINRRKPTARRDVLHEDGTPTGTTATIETIHRQGLWHREVQIGLYTKSGEVLLQKRAAGVILDASKWDIGCAGGVDAGETSRQAAVRECYEEIGLQVPPASLQFVFTERYNHYLPHYAFHQRCLIDVFLAPITGREKLELQKEEVAAVTTVPLAEARHILEQSAALTMHGFKERVLESIQTRF